MSIQRYKAHRDSFSDCYCDIEPDDIGEWITFEAHQAALSSLQAKHDRAIEALEECKWRLAAHQPVNGPVHPNDVKAFDLAEQALADEVTDERF